MPSIRFLSLAILLAATPALAEDERLNETQAPKLPPGVVARVGSTNFRHSAPVTDFACSPDGKWIATISTYKLDGTARLWDAVTGKEKYRVPVKVISLGSVGAGTVGFSADAKSFLVLDGARLRAFDIASGKMTTSHPLGKSGDWGPGGLAISPDGDAFVEARPSSKFVVRGVGDGAVRVEGDYVSRNYAFVGVRFAPDGKRILFHVGDQLAYLHDARTGKQICEVVIPENAERRLFAGFQSSGEQLIALVTDAESTRAAAVLSEATTGKTVREWKLAPESYLIAASADGKHLAVCDRVAIFVALLDAETGREVARLPGVRGQLAELRFSPDGKLLLGRSLLGATLSVWDVSRRDFHAAHPSHLDYHFFTKDGAGLACLDHGWTILDWRSGKVLRRIPPFVERASFFEAPFGDTRTAVVPTPTGIRIVDTATRERVGEIRGEELRLRDLARGCDYFVVADIVASLVIYDREGRERLKIDRKGQHAYSPLSLSDDGRRLATYWDVNRPDGGAVAIWDVEAKSERARILPGSRLFHVKLSPDGEYLAGTTQSDRDSPIDVRLWETRTGKPLATLTGHGVEPARGYSAVRVSFSPDGRRLLTGDPKGTIRLWEVTTSQMLAKFDGHATMASPLFAPDGRRFSGVSDDAPCFIWDCFGVPEKIDLSADQIWAGLQETDGTKLFRAMKALVLDPDAALKLLTARLEPATAIDPKLVDRLLGELDADRFATRERATGELKKIVGRIEPKLRTALEAAKTEDAKTRLKVILESIDPANPELLRPLRSVEVLEMIGTPEAVKLLDRLATGAADEPLTRSAAGAAKRVRERTPR